MKEKRFNALTRAIPISTRPKTYVPYIEDLFQCPYSGYSHFYAMLCKGA